MSETPTPGGLLRAERLVVIGPDGSRYREDDDLAGHRSGSSVGSELGEESVEVLVVGTTGITFLVDLPRLVPWERPRPTGRSPSY